MIYDFESSQSNIFVLMLFSAFKFLLQNNIVILFKTNSFWPVNKLLSSYADRLKTEKFSSRIKYRQIKVSLKISFVVVWIAIWFSSTEETFPIFSAWT